MPLRLTPKLHSSVTLPDGRVVTSSGLVVESLTKKQASAFSSFLRIEEARPEDPPISVSKPKFVYDGPDASAAFNLIRGVFTRGVPRDDLTNSEVSVARTLTGALREI